MTKSFGSTVAVNQVSVDLVAGEIHALVGENGAGKSTLIRVLAGDYTADSGEIMLNGRAVRFTHPREAIEHGVGCVHQIPMFVPNLSVTENLLLGVPYERRRAGLIDWRAEHRAARADLAEVGLTVDPRTALETLRAHERQLVAVARALKRGLIVLVLDEVTASLSEPEVRILHQVVRNLRDRGVTIIYISHRLDEIFRLADRVTVMRDGKRVATLAVEGLSQKEVAGHIVGTAIDHLFARKTTAVAATREQPVLAVRGLGDGKLDDISFDLQPGEILGVSGLGGSGRTRLLHCLFGVHGFSTGEILIDGKRCRFRDAADALAAGVALVTEDRQEDGYVQTLPVWQNVTLPWARRFSRFGLLNLAEERKTAAESTARLDVRMPAITALMTQLSGGNQQKAIFSRWIANPIKILLLDEPTHGVDIRSKAQIYEIIRSLAGEGVAVIIVSSELEEFEAMCNRVLLLREGKMIGEIEGEQISKDAILHTLLAEN
ncbi:MAG: sugar ABC transporter ATP-binding protein [Alphaproteobacteria bacterium]|nr:sugar ABC transporter ATP-binding protein [Alphaproteobacteria bacterium]